MSQATQRLSFLIPVLCACLALTLGFAAAPAQAQHTLNVNSVADDGDVNPGDKICGTSAGECTLRAAIEEINDEDIQDQWVIDFSNIPTSTENGRQVARIVATNEYQLSGSRVEIRGDTAPGWTAGEPPIVYLDGSNLTNGTYDGFDLRAGSDSSSIVGLGIVGFPDDGINVTRLSGANPIFLTTIQYCWIGIEPDGTANGNNRIPRLGGLVQAGININQPIQVIIGAVGSDPPPSIETFLVPYDQGGENVIGGNLGHGIFIEHDETETARRQESEVVIANNYIGLLPDGTTPRGNDLYGVRIDFARENYIGWVSSTTPRETFRNYFAGNGLGAMYLNTNETRVMANYLGITADATSTSDALAPGRQAILVTRPDRFRNNIIGHEFDEDRSSGKGNVFGGYVYGVRLGTASSNIENGNNERVRGNYFGVTPDGNSVPLDSAGVYAPFADSLRIVENVFGNIGSGGAESAAISIPRETQGFQRIQENLIGVLDDGSAHPIDGNGIYYNDVGRSNSIIEENVIGNATQNGIFVSNIDDRFSRLAIQRNSIGSTPAGADIGNGDAGIRMVNAVVGYIGPSTFSTSEDEGNLIGFNGGPGVAVTGDDSRVRIRFNEFRSNGGPMIDLGDDGNTPNDPSNGDNDTGLNKLLNTPEVVTFNCQTGLSTDNLELTYRVPTTPANANFDDTDGILIDIYSGSAPDRVDNHLMTDNYQDTDAFSDKTISVSAPNLCAQYLFLTTTDDGVGSPEPEESSTSEFFNPAPLLPVELAAFDVLPTGDRGAELVWETLQEKNNDRFEIEHLAPEASGWSRIGTTRGAGTTTERQRYTFAVSDLEIGTHAFRLRQVDVDGTQELLEEKSVEIRLSVAYELRVGPNPMRSTANGVLTLREGQTVRAVVYDVLGREVAVVHDGAMETGKNSFSIDASRLGSGRYFLRVVGESFRDTQPFTVVR